MSSRQGAGVWSPEEVKLHSVYKTERIKESLVLWTQFSFFLSAAVKIFSLPLRFIS